MTIDLRERVDRCEEGFIDCAVYVECVEEVWYHAATTFDKVWCFAISRCSTGFGFVVEGCSGKEDCDVRCDLTG